MSAKEIFTWVSCGFLKSLAGHANYFMEAPHPSRSTLQCVSVGRRVRGEESCFRIFRT